MTTRIGFTFAILFACALVARADERADFLAAYPAAAAQLEAAYGHSRIAYTVERQGDGRNQISEVEILTDGASRRITTNVTQGYDNEPPRLTVWAHNKGKAFSLNYVGSKYAIDFFNPLYRPMPTDPVKAISTGYEVVRGPWTGTGATPISEWLKWDKLKIESVKQTKEGIELRVSAPDDGYGAYTWRLVFAPITYAVTVDDSVCSDGGTKYFHHLGYDGGNPPKIMRVKEWSESADGKIFGRADFNVTSFEFGRQSPELFTLAAYGLTEPGIRLSAGTIGLIVAAIAAAALGVWCLYAAERRRKAKP
jgi:hypothetical protein